ncbi:MAG: HAD family hydrolase [Myxococcota bacterium]|jgi:FMN phosphatase YigB (HAD superfamily)|nr:HAD family hydrolase [Myxococcota bacterium]
MHLRALSLDLDGTLARLPAWQLLRWKPLWTRGADLWAYRQVVEEHREVRATDLEDRLWRAVATRRGWNESDRTDSVRKLVDCQWPELYARAHVPAPVRKLIDAWDQTGLPRVVVSDHPALAKLHAMELAEGWAAVVGARQLGAFKPHPDALLAACAQLGLRPDQVVHVGDRWDTDGLAAARAGCSFVHVDQLARSDLLARLQNRPGPEA